MCDAERVAVLVFLGCVGVGTRSSIPGQCLSCELAGAAVAFRGTTAPAPAHFASLFPLLDGPRISACQTDRPVE